MGHISYWMEPGADRKGHDSFSDLKTGVLLASMSKTLE